MAMEECEYRETHPAIATEIATLKKENDDRKADERRIFERLDGFGQRLSSMEGRLAGYVLVGSVLTVALMLVAKKVLGVG
jgi:hypothetical protein